MQEIMKTSHRTDFQREIGMSDTLVDSHELNDVPVSQKLQKCSFSSSTASSET